jgi:hypothetical protein
MGVLLFFPSPSSVINPKAGSLLSIRGILSNHSNLQPLYMFLLLLFPSVLSKGTNA